MTVNGRGLSSDIHTYLFGTSQKSEALLTSMYEFILHKESTTDKYPRAFEDLEEIAFPTEL